jgi:hypothetical protein
LKLLCLNFGVLTGELDYQVGHRNLIWRDALVKA